MKPGRPSKFTEKEKGEIRRLRDENLSYAELAGRFGVSVNTIIRICNPDYYHKQKESNKIYQTNNAEKIMNRQMTSYRQFRFRFHVINDAEIIAFLEKQENVQNYLRQRVLEDIAKQKEIK